MQPRENNPWFPVRSPRAADLAFGDELLLVAVGGVPRDLAGPQRQAHHQVGTAHHHQGKHVEQDDHTHNVPEGTGVMRSELGSQRVRVRVRVTEG